MPRIDDSGDPVSAAAQQWVDTYISSGGSVAAADAAQPIYVAPPSYTTSTPAPPPPPTTIDYGSPYAPGPAAPAAGSPYPPSPAPSPPAGGGPVDISYTPAGGGTGGVTSGPNTGGAAGTNYPIDWQTALGMFGLPADVVAYIDNIFRTVSDPTQAATIAMAYIRGTQWYRDNYPGIQDGINKGLFQDERGYRAYSNNINQVYQQYYNRNALPSEIAATINKGWDPSQVAQHFDAQARTGTLQIDPLKALFTPDELRQIGEAQAGIGNEASMILAQKADLALRVNMLYSNFYGRQVTRDELNTLWSSGLSPEQVAQNFAKESNVAGMAPWVRNIFTTDEIQTMALEQAGGTTQQGKALLQQLDLASQLNTVFATYGRQLTRADVANIYASGLSPEQVARQFESGTITGSLPAYLKDLFTQEELNAAADEQSGAHPSAEGKRVLAEIAQAQAFNTVYALNVGRPITRGELDEYFQQGVTPDTVARRFQSGQIAGSQAEYIRQLFTPEELKKAADEQSGAAPSAEGRALLEEINQAQAYMMAYATTGRTLTRQELDQYTQQGVSPDLLARRFAGANYAAVNAPDIQYALGAFGEGQLNADQLRALGEQTAGINTVLGGQLDKKLQEAKQRLDRIFQGTLATPSLSLLNGGRVYSPSLSGGRLSSDVGK